MSITETGQLIDVATRLKEQLATKRDLLADTRRVTLDRPLVGLDGASAIYGEGVDMVIELPAGAESFGVTRHAHGQLSSYLGVPQKLYDRLLGTHPDLYTHLANGLLSREPSTRMLRTLDGQVRAFLSDRYRPRDNWDLLEQAVLPELTAFTGRAVIKKCDLTETRMYVKIVLPDLERQVTPKVGDIVRGGLIIQNSEVGAAALSVSPYTDRLICTNGMVHTEFGQRNRHVGRRQESVDEAWELYSDATLALDDAAFFAKVRDTIRATLTETVFDRIVEQMRDLSDIRIPGDPVKQVEVLGSRHGFTEAEQGSMLAALIEGADLSAYGYLQSITQTARDTEDADRQTELETIAGRMLSDSRWALAEELVAA